MRSLFLVSAHTAFASEADRYQRRDGEFLPVKRGGMRTEAAPMDP